MGPCIGAASKDEYHKVIQQVIMFMEGKTDPVLDDLRHKMEEASGTLEFERAAGLRDQIRNIQQVIEEQRIKVASNSGQDMDVIAMAQAQDEARVEIFFVRQGKLVGRDHFVMEGTQDDTSGHILEEFIKQFYQSASVTPQRILVQHPLEDQESIEAWLRERRGGAVTLSRPVRGDNAKLVKMVAENAAQGLTQMRARWLSNADAVQEAMAELQEELNLPNLPLRMECYDISNIQGTNAVGSMVTFQNGFPKPAHYRRFRIKDVAGIDDYAMMQEMLRRRFKRLAAEKGKGRAVVDDGQGEETRTRGQDTWAIVPDLVLIDGGKGHLSAALEVFLELGIDFVPLAAIAKENEWLFVPHTPEPIALDANSQALYLGAAHPGRSPPLRRHLPPQAAQQGQRSVGRGPGVGHRPQEEADAPAPVRIGEGHKGSRRRGDRLGAGHDPGAGGQAQTGPVTPSPWPLSHTHRERVTHRWEPSGAAPH